ncbi:hypothetical protein Gogos_017065 [Gossypium gossypioides]|uniref:Myb/SANT-like domain-containing protein n=1 Tax=Gossypium gossypioides TaxID=34282 RepID=A0A7J9B9J6_GOSGO|nr:hypothetical protein [Gossypium gossypioides]
MFNEKDNRGFGWDEHRQMVVAEDVVWNSYITTRKDAQTPADIVEEIDAEDVVTANNLEEKKITVDAKMMFSLDDMDVLATQLQPPKPNQDGTTSSKKKKIDDGIEEISTSIIDAAMLLGENIRTAGLELSRSIAFEKMIQESAQKSYLALCEVEGLTEDERYRALSKVPDHPMQMLIFFSLPSSVRLEWVRKFLSDH